MHSNKIFVAYPAGHWQVPAIQEAKKLGLHVVAADAEQTSTGREIADEFVFLKNPLDTSPIEDRLVTLQGELSGVLSYCSDVGQIFAAQLRDRHELPGDSVAVTNVLTNKSLQRKALQESFPMDFFWQVCSSEVEALSAIASGMGTLIIKPVDSSGSRGVARVASASRDCRDIVRAAFLESARNQVLVETFLEGVEYAVDGFVIDGRTTVLTVLEKKRSPQNPMVASTLVAIERETPTFNQLGSFASNVMESLGKSRGPFHLEAIMTASGEVVLVEAAPRGGGFGLATAFISSLTELNYARLSVLDAIGARISQEDLRLSMQRGGVMHFFSPGEEQALSYCARLSTEKNGICVQAFESLKSMRGVESDGDRIGSATFLADSQAEALLSFEKFQAEIAKFSQESNLWP